MTEFAVLRAPSQVLFGVGMAAAAGRVAAEHGRRVLVCTDPIIADTPGFATVRDVAGRAEVAVFADAAVDVPRSAIDAAVALGRAHAPDVIVAVGGGSVIDLAKVTALLLAHGGALEDYYPVQSVPGPDRAADRAADHRRHRLGGDAGLGHHRPEDRDEDRRREPAPDPAPRDLRPAADRRRAAHGHRARGHRRALARDRGLHGRARGAVGPTSSSAARRSARTCSRTRSR